MTFAVRERNQFEDTKVLLPLFLFSVDSRETFLGSFYPCHLQINKSNFFELPSKLVTDREIAEPTVTVLIYVFSVLLECFLTNFTLAVFQVKRSVFVPPPKFVTVKGLAEPKVTVFVIFAFSGLQRTFLSNFYPCRLWGK